ACVGRRVRQRRPAHLSRAVARPRRGGDGRPVQPGDELAGPAARLERGGAVAPLAGSALDQPPAQRRASVPISCPCYFDGASRNSRTASVISAGRSRKVPWPAAGTIIS